MKTFMLTSSLLLSSFAFAGGDEFMHKETIKCGKDGCAIVCHQPTARWDSYLQSKGDLEVTYFHNSGNRQIKADMGNGEYTILDTNPSLQSCRISGVVK